MADTNLGADTVKLATTILAGIRRARPNDPMRPKTVDELVALSLAGMKRHVELVFPEYFETKPAAPVVKRAGG